MYRCTSICQVEVAPRSHRHAKRADLRLRPRLANRRRYAQTRMGRPPPHVHGKEGVDGSSPSEGFRKGQQMASLLPRRDTTGSRAPLNLSPRPVPSVRARGCSWLGHRDRRAESTSYLGRCSNVFFRAEIVGVGVMHDARSTDADLMRKVRVAGDARWRYRPRTCPHARMYLPSVACTEECAPPVQHERPATRREHSSRLTSCRARFDTTGFQPVTSWTSPNCFMW